MFCYSPFVVGSGRGLYLCGWYDSCTISFIFESQRLLYFERRINTCLKKENSINGINNKEEFVDATDFTFGFNSLEEASNKLEEALIKFKEILRSIDKIESYIKKAEIAREETRQKVIDCLGNDGKDYKGRDAYDLTIDEFKLDEEEES